MFYILQSHIAINKISQHGRVFHLNFTGDMIIAYKSDDSFWLTLNIFLLDFKSSSDAAYRSKSQSKPKEAGAIPPYAEVGHRPFRCRILFAVPNHYLGWCCIQPWEINMGKFNMKLKIFSFIKPQFRSSCWIAIRGFHSCVYVQKLIWNQRCAQKFHKNI